MHIIKAEYSCVPQGKATTHRIRLTYTDDWWVEIWTKHEGIYGWTLISSGHKTFESAEKWLKEHGTETV